MTMPTIYTRGPARVDVTELGGGGLGPWLALLVLLLVASGAAAHAVHSVAEVLISVAEIIGCVAAGAALVTGGILLIRARIRARRRREAGVLSAMQQVPQSVHVITTAVRPRQIEAPRAELPALPDVERAAREGWWRQ
jgi:hypothetical protein